MVMAEETVFRVGGLDVKHPILAISVMRETEGEISYTCAGEMVESD